VSLQVCSLGDELSQVYCWPTGTTSKHLLERGSRELRSLLKILIF
jgi:hypothetical protein